MKRRAGDRKKVDWAVEVFAIVIFAGAVLVAVCALVAMYYLVQSI